MKKDFLLILVVAVLGITAYAPSFSGGFVYDDLVTIQDNLFIRDWNNLSQFLSTDYYQRAEEYSFRPLVTLTYFVDWHFWGLNPWGYHLANLAWHLLTAATLFFLAKKISSSSSFGFIAALIFVIHPATVEAVAGISFREDLICAWLVMVGLILFLQSLLSSTFLRRNLFALGALIAMLGGLLAKEMSVTFPLLAVAVAGNSRAGLKRARPWLVGFFVLAFLYTLARFSVLFQPGVLPSTPEFGDPLTRIFLIFKSWGLYVLRALLPLNLTVEYPDPLPFNVWGNIFLTATFSAPALFLWAWKFAPRQQKNQARLGLAWFGLSLLPILNLMPSPRLGAERFMYLPLAGFAIWAASIWEGSRSIKQKKILRNLIGIVILISLGTGSFLRCRAWENNLHLFSDAAKKSPLSSKARHGLGNELFRQGRVREAIPEFLAAIKIFNREPFYYNSLGVAYGELGRFEDSRQYFKTSQLLNPQDPTVLVNLAVLSLRMGNIPLARQEITTYIQARDYDPQGYLILGEIELAAENQTAARDAFIQALNQNPHHVPALEGLGYTLFLQGELAQARKIWGNILLLEPDNLRVRELLRRTSKP